MGKKRYQVRQKIDGSMLPLPVQVPGKPPGLMMIDPRWAAWMMGQRAAPGQRELINSKIEEFVRQMHQQEWVEAINARNPIVIRDGFVVNGRHRLAVIARMSEPVAAFILFESTVEGT